MFPGQAEHLSGPCRIDHVVPDNPMMIGPESCHQRIMIGKRLGRKGRPHSRKYAVCLQLRKARRDAPIQIVRAESVDADQDRDRPVPGGGRGGKGSDKACRENEDKADHGPVLTKGITFPVV